MFKIVVATEVSTGARGFSRNLKLNINLLLLKRHEGNMELSQNILEDENILCSSSFCHATTEAEVK